MARAIDFYYRGGAIKVLCRTRPRAVRGITLQGSPWRGLVVLPGLVLVGYGYLLPGFLLLGLALPWSIIAVAKNNWGEVTAHHRVARMAELGDLAGAYDMLMDDSEAPWLWLVGKAMEAGNWELALDSLANIEGQEEEKLVWQAVCHLELGTPERALASLPHRQLRDITLVRAQSLYRLGDWAKLIALGRRVSGDDRDKSEFLWLRAKAYLASGEERSARHLLRQLAAKAGNDYGDAGELLLELMGREGKK